MSSLKLSRKQIAIGSVAGFVFGVFLLLVIFAIKTNLDNKKGEANRKIAYELFHEIQDREVRAMIYETRNGSLTKEQAESLKIDLGSLKMQLATPEGSVEKMDFSNVNMEYLRERVNIACKRFDLLFRN